MWTHRRRPRVHCRNQIRVATPRLHPEGNRSSECSRHLLLQVKILEVAEHPVPPPSTPRIPVLSDIPPGRPVHPLKRTLPTEAKTTW
eukprot:2087372-Alexandrium_andersonii.AAC.2